MANPMVVEMKRLDQQLTEVNAQLDTQAEHDAAQIDALSQDRERLHAELNRVKSLLQQQQKSSATRMEDVEMQPVSHPFQSRGSLMQAASSQSQEGQVRQVQQAPPGMLETDMEQIVPGERVQERQTFGQVRRPNKKKENM
jgi:hypothetical protein